MTTAVAGSRALSGGVHITFHNLETFTPLNKTF